MKQKQNILFKELEKRGFDFTDLKDFNVWINETIIKGLKTLDEGYFGIDLLSWKEYSSPFRDVYVYQFDMVFKNKDKDKVYQIITKFKQGKISLTKCGKLLEKLAIYKCLWE